MGRRMSVFSFVVCLILARMAIKVTAFMLFIYPTEHREGGGDRIEQSQIRQESQRDLERTGQVVTRGGQLVVMLDDTDPDNEVYRLLNPADADAFLFGMNPIWPSLAIGTFVFVGLATGVRVLGSGSARERG